MVNPIELTTQSEGTEEMAGLHTSQVLKILKIRYETLDKWCKNGKVKKWKWKESAGFKYREFDETEIMKIKASIPAKRKRGFPLIPPK